MKISCCVFDLDGTLLTSEHHISDTDKKTLKDLNETGVKIVIATGRSIHQIKEYIAELGITGPIITYNGALVSNTQTGEIITKRTFTRDAIIEIERVMKEDNLNYFFYTSNHVYYARDCEYSRYQLYYNTTLPEDLRIPILPFSEMPDEEYSDVLVVAINNDTGLIPSIKRKIENFGEFTFVDSGKNIIDILPKNTNKGEAIKTLTSHFKIPISETVAFGDSQNDESMFENVGFSVAMGNAYDSLKRKADFITKSNDEYGITHALNVLLKKTE